jgi:hypothetical protein
MKTEIYKQLIEKQKELINRFLKGNLQIHPNDYSDYQKLRDEISALEKQIEQPAVQLTDEEIKIQLHRILSDYYRRTGYPVESATADILHLFKKQSQVSLRDELVKCLDHIGYVYGSADKLVDEYLKTKQ